MFKVKNIHTSEIFTVYSVSTTGVGYIHFLVYDKEWGWKSASNFVPVEEL